ncbi:hypothetical protein DFH09DRAFT_1312547 [Mycena vulgaris]|nr:hypothetical protein DFH09DRAFT_1312547 [Mycena vulgaris]
MFPSASIAFAVLISFSALAVRSAPVAVSAARTQRIAPDKAHALAQSSLPQACTGVKGTGTCVVLQTGACNNVSNIKSLVFPNPDDECSSSTSPNCNNDDNVALELFNLNSDSLPAGIRSLEC